MTDRREECIMLRSLTINTNRQGLHEITDPIAAIVKDPEAGLSSDGSGLCTVFVQHTSASLVIQENADPSARRDLEAWLNRLVREDDPLYTHTAEGLDDMPSHVKAILTATSLAIPIEHRRLGLGTWQGIYLWEHRKRPHSRRVLVHVGA